MEPNDPKAPMTQDNPNFINKAWQIGNAVAQRSSLIQDFKQTLGSFKPFLCLVCKERHASEKALKAHLEKTSDHDHRVYRMKKGLPGALDPENQKKKKEQTTVPPGET